MDFIFGPFVHLPLICFYILCTFLAIYPEQPYEIPKILYAFLALGVYQSAFTSETIRAAFISVNKGEIEAAHAMGMSYPQILFKIIIPEAAEVAVPGLVLIH